MANRLRHILGKAHREEALAPDEVAFLLTLDDPGQTDLLCRSAAVLRARYFDDRIFLYGFLYLSTYCRNDCSFCFYRRSNRRPQRYRRDGGEIIGAARKLAESGVHLIDLTLGEDPHYTDGHPAGSGRLGQLVEEVRQAAGLPVMVSPGVLSAEGIRDLASAGADWYACYQETFSRGLFNRLRPGQSFVERLRAKTVARGCGLLIEEGLLCRAGESRDDLAHAIAAMGPLGPSQMRAMTFVPQPGTPMEAWPSPDYRLELLVMAVLRLIYPRALIPASLDVAGLDGLKPRLDAGANVITSLVPPGLGLAGVARPSLDIADARRSTASVLPVLTANRLQAASVADYRQWIERERSRIMPGEVGGRTECASA